MWEELGRSSGLSKVDHSQADTARGPVANSGGKPCRDHARRHGHGKRRLDGGTVQPEDPTDQAHLASQPGGATTRGLHEQGITRDCGLNLPKLPRSSDVVAVFIARSRKSLLAAGQMKRLGKAHRVLNLDLDNPVEPSKVALA